jgi:hypothetical protein
MGGLMVCEIRRGFEPQNMDAPIWHYMRRIHAEELFATSKLRFKQVSSWGDQMEGRINTESRRLIRQRDENMRAVDGIPFFRQDEHFELMEMLPRTTNYGSCWSYNPPTEATMWNELNLGADDVALESSVGALLNLTQQEFMFSSIGQVRYWPPSSGVDHFDSNDYLFRKRDNFQHEREVRLMIDMEWEPEFSGSNPGPDWVSHVDIPIKLEKILGVTNRSDLSVNL